MAGDRVDLETDDVAALIASVIPEHGARLEVQGEIARGGMASIRVGVDRALQRRVAMKQLLDGHTDSLLAVRSLVREAQITGQLDHPNIVPVHELGVDERGGLFFTMKLVEGRTLLELIDALRSTHDRTDAAGLRVATAVGHDDLLRLLDVFFKVLDAVAFAHSRGVVHCDLKPDNVMVGDYGQVYLMDWGIAKVMPPPVGGDPLARSRRVRDPLPLVAANANIIMGTPAYMSPEQARGEQRQIDPRSDVFELGAMLFEILTGHPPYQGRNAVDVLLQAEAGGAKLPKQLAIPRELRRIVSVAMASSPVDRYARVEDMQADLQGFMRGGGNFPRQTFAAKQWIIREHEVGDAAYILISGRCEVFKDINGKQESLRTLGPGDVFGETAILASTPRTASVVALTDVVAMSVTASVLEREVDAMKPWMGAFIRALAQRFSEVTARPHASPSGAELSRSVVANSRTGRTQRPLRSIEPTQGSLNEPAQVANQAMMLLESWGKWDRDLGNTMSLKRACAALATICGIAESEVLGRLQSFKQFSIEPKHDSISLRDKHGLSEELRRVLGI
ncbi:Serine/threonine-protein kinase PknB [Enhygromyxa salina]|uniref:Serine/threonine-protein kinase PknB n=1 Tax=Enhygromyxa salina TaxID=215803 RepID=A0A0C2CZW1_9BACT|nr:serine/threonine-protein kinase [Enhygromyxa salina]KIG15145.1 Serine/threonine-protein kinase PknB [Enhygromyxa salina]